MRLSRMSLVFALALAGAAMLGKFGVQVGEGTNFTW